MDKKLILIDDKSKDSVCTCNYAGLRGESQCNHCIKNMEECEF